MSWSIHIPYVQVAQYHFSGVQTSYDVIPWAHPIIIWVYRSLGLCDHIQFPLWICEDPVLPCKFVCLSLVISFQTWHYRSLGLFYHMQFPLWICENSSLPCKFVCLSLVISFQPWQRPRSPFYSVYHAFPFPLSHLWKIKPPSWAIHQESHL